MSIHCNQQLILHHSSYFPQIFCKLDDAIPTTAIQAMITTATPPATPQRPPPASSGGAPRRNVASQLLKRQGLVRNGGDVQMRDTSGFRTTGGRVRSHIGLSRDILRKGHSTGFDKLRVSLNVCYIPCATFSIHVDSFVNAPTARYLQCSSLPLVRSLVALGHAWRRQNTHIETHCYPCACPRRHAEDYQ